jgi:DNA repair exonuclease SbcCD ATPase subunit
MDYRERVRQLQSEIKQLSDAIEEYNKKRYRTPLDKHVQEMRGQRLQQIIDELAQIADRKKDQQGQIGAH